MDEAPANSDTVTSHGQVTDSKAKESPDASVKTLVPKKTSLLIPESASEPGGKGTLIRDNLERTLAHAGWQRHEAWFGPDVISEANRSSPQGSPAERKRAQRMRDQAGGWRECTVKAPDDADARALMAAVGLAIADTAKREAVKKAVTQQISTTD